MFLLVLTSEEITYFLIAAGITALALIVGVKLFKKAKE